MTPSILYPSSDTYYAFQHHHTQGSHDIPLFGYPDYTQQLQPQPVYRTPFPYPPNLYYCQNLPTMAQPNPAEMEDFQRLSDDYRANLPGPLIGEKLPMSVLATEYAQADPTYVTKTEALVQTYSRYRNIKGDGQCGWRATVFGYFETLLQLGDYDIVQQERVRLLSFEDTMRMAGIDYDIIIDMFDYTWELFDDLQKAVEQQDKSDAVILQFLNDENRSDSIVYHFKMMTSAFMQLRADQYEPFLEIPIAEYRVTRIDPSNQEIDQIGLQALTDAVIAPANFALEVLYLDRSMGGEVTPHSFVADPVGKPTLRLLYRPGHYDIIYKESFSTQVFSQKDSIIPQNIQMAEPSSICADLQAYLFSGPAAAQQNHGSGPYYHVESSSNFQSKDQPLFAPYPAASQPIAPHSFAVPSSQSPAVLDMDFPQDYQVRYSSSCPLDESPSPLVTTSPMSTCIPASPLPVKKPTNQPQIRLNANCFNYRQRHESVPLCTQTYGSAAASSTAHFRNTDFQPQIWRAEEEYLKT